MVNGHPFASTDQNMSQQKINKESSRCWLIKRKITSLSKHAGGGRRLENNYESNLEPLCSLLGEQGCRMGMTRAAYGTNQWSLAPQWHPSRQTGAPVATIDQMYKRAPVPAAELEPHAPSRRAVRNAAERGNVERMEHSEQAMPWLQRSS